MIKKFCVVFLTILTASCSNLDKKSLDNGAELKKKLVSKIELIQKDLENNKLETLKSTLDMPIEGNYIINELSKYNLSKVKVYFTPPTVENRTGKNIVGIRYGENMLYYNLKYKYLDGKWRIVKFIEGR